MENKDRRKWAIRMKENFKDQYQSAKVIHPSFILEFRTQSLRDTYIDKILEELKNENENNVFHQYTITRIEEKMALNMTLEEKIQEDEERE